MILVTDTKTGKIEMVKNFVYGNKSSSFLVTQEKLNKNGVSCDQYFTERDFIERFTGAYVDNFREQRVGTP